MAGRRGSDRIGTWTRKASVSGTPCWHSLWFTTFMLWTLVSTNYLCGRIELFIFYIKGKSKSWSVLLHFHLYKPQVGPTVTTRAEKKLSLVWVLEWQPSPATPLAIVPFCTYQLMGSPVPHYSLQGVHDTSMLDRSSLSHVRHHPPGFEPVSTCTDWGKKGNPVRVNCFTVLGYLPFFPAESNKCHSTNMIL